MSIMRTYKVHREKGWEEHTYDTLHFEAHLFNRQILKVITHNPSVSFCPITFDTRSIDELIEMLQAIKEDLK